MLPVGAPAPAFILTSQNGVVVNSQNLKGQRYVLFFYPKDNTPGCTREACAFREAMPTFKKHGVPVFGISADTEVSHARFASRHGLNFPLLADPNHRLLEPYGVWVEKSLYGRKYFGVLRCTFVIDSDGKIEKVWDKVNPDQHAEEVTAYLLGKTSDVEAKVPVKTATKSAIKKTAVTTKDKAAIKKAAPRKAKIS